MVCIVGDRFILVRPLDIPIALMNEIPSDDYDDVLQRGFDIGVQKVRTNGCFIYIVTTEILNLS